LRGTIEIGIEAVESRENSWVRVTFEGVIRFNGGEEGGELGVDVLDGV